MANINTTGSIRNVNFSVNLHPAFFQQDLPPTPYPRTSESVEKERALTFLPQISKQVKGYSLYKESGPDDRIGDYILKGTWTDSPLMHAFFSNKNRDLIKNSIKYEVYFGSGKKHLIDMNAQNESELLIVMRSIFLQYSKNLPGSINYDNIDPYVIRTQIKELNDYVITEIAPKMISNIEQYLGYLYDASHNPVPIEHPRNLSSAGTKALRSTTDILFGDDFFDANNPGLFSNQGPVTMPQLPSKQINFGM